MTRILFVCANNFFLSPLAAALLERRLADLGIAGGFAIDSAGTHPGLTPRAPERHAQELALCAGKDISGRLTRAVTREDLFGSDLIYVMTDADYWHIESLAAEAVRVKARLFLLEFLQGRGLHEMLDPVLGEIGYEEAFRLLSDACERCAEELRRRMPAVRP